jgi:glycosyltransferase involved in cell wall biosynthesis
MPYSGEQGFIIITQPLRMREMSSIKISVIIPTHNRAHLLRNCLYSLERQEFDKNLFEVIVINDGSIDDTRQLLEDFKKKTEITFNFINQENKGVSFSRNVGIDNARGEYIAFTDDDCIVPEDWLLRMHHDFVSVDETVAGIGGPLDCFALNEKLYASRFIQFLDEFNYIPVARKFIIFHTHISKLRGDEQIPYLRTSNAIFRKKCLKEVGGFDINFKRAGGEDPDLCYRLLNLNYQFFFDKNLVVLHHTRESILSYFKSFKNYMEGEVRKNKKSHLYKNKIVRQSYQYLIPRKIIIAFLFCCLYPLSVLGMWRQKKYPLFDVISFPFIVIASKFLALAFSVFYHIKYLKAAKS